jgi:hypothetical protein
MVGHNLASWLVIRTDSDAKTALSNYYLVKSTA